ncbi:MAG TPA: 16S rRNA (adenine(1518)-N(6)/adenine(1519)-N(6))-dimethyltransferase RsmA [Spirochaetia bacterium]|nr:16S rRNA (adenine(1518)-N(6)/adenine(1519)-N(6))-dimethyltransferase RsmA [Spirochaetales bacterium]HRS64568.1 16S rRNA (adenine(1518)-N(6)/adenine(1519)-N(6))-dimethyltransferase RsmA [Spirochaetia bacterium]HRV27406.1 16S rRNA (adenine(1518)-N(6)/adenine(1519)-N(6))-dimethyltransferase RsmA [Spirochaetia bacterium]
MKQLQYDELKQLYTAPTKLSAFLAGEEWGMQKRFGQNFLLDEVIRKKIVDAVQLEKDSYAWEIGPGLGSLTFLATEQCNNLVVFEIDHGFAEFIRNHYPAITVYEGDFLKTWNRALSEKGMPYRVFGNLPYNAASAIIAELLEHNVHPDSMVFTVQREAAERMCAQPGSKNYSAFSVLCASLYTSRIIMDLRAEYFWPQPRVKSSVVLMTKRNNPCKHAGESAFTQFTRACFLSRRKMLKNNLKKTGFTDETIAQAYSRAGIAVDVRAEDLSVDTFDTLYEYLHQPNS